MVKWTDLLLISGVAIGAGAIAKYTGAGKGLAEIAGGVTEIGISPFRAIGTGLGEAASGVERAAMSIGAVGKGIQEALQSIGAGLAGLETKVPGQCQSEGCRPRPLFAACNADEQITGLLGDCCCKSQRTGIRPIPSPIPSPIIPIPITNPNFDEGVREGARPSYTPDKPLPAPKGQYYWDPCQNEWASLPQGNRASDFGYCAGGVTETRY